NPLCCPARASVLTGQYSHNHGVLTNATAAGGGFPAFDDSSTLATWLTDAGYLTGFVGKYLNGYGHRGYGQDPRYVPPGWTRWQGAVDPSTYRYFNQRLNENGAVRHYPGVYSTDLFTRKTQRFIEYGAWRSEPFFFWTAFVAPHFGGPIEPDDPLADDGLGPRTPGLTDEYRDRYADVALPRDPSFNEEDVSDKAAKVRAKGRLDDTAVAALTERYQQRLESLAAVDDSVKLIIDTLREHGELDNTYIIFTSDNGLLSGEHRLTGKRQPFEPSIRVPLLIRGPGIPPGSTVGQFSGTIDLAPTVVDIALADAGLTMDGRSLLPTATGRRAPSRTMLIEAGKSNASGLLWSGVRTSRWTYVEYRSGHVELYDLRHDPFQLDSLAGERSYAAAEQRLAAELDALRDCAGQSCR
ncbi:MAG: sulfatase, partial [Nocardioidaceae bacterium]|nr:sulfatase [Nocardioidaceae bacterium]